MEQRLGTLRYIDQMTPADGFYKMRAATMAAAHEGLFAEYRSSEALARLDRHELESLYLATYTAAFYTIDQKHIRYMAMILDELHARKAASKEQDMHMYEMFVEARLLAEAQEFVRRHPLSELKVVPAWHEAPNLITDQPTELMIDANTHDLLRRQVDVRRPAQVVVVASPMCHFSQDAMQALQADPELSQVFDRNTVWLAPQETALDLDIFQQWNRDHPGKQATWVFRREEWPMIDYWGTPTFYFLQNGAVSAKVTGWPKEGQRAELRSALQQIGLL